MKEKLNITIWLLKVVFKAAPFTTLIHLFFFILFNLERIITSLVTALIIDALIKAVDNKSGIDTLIPYIILLVGIRLLVSAIHVWTTDTNRILKQKVKNYVPRVMLHKKLYELDIQSLETNNVQNLITRYLDNQGEIFATFEVIVNFMGLMANIIAAGITVSFLSPWLVLLMILVSFPTFFTSRYFIKQNFEINVRHTEPSRKASGVLSNIISPERMKEIKLIGGYKYIANIYDEYFKNYYKEYKRNRINWGISTVITRTFTYAGVGIALYSVFNEILLGNLSVGFAAFYISMTVDFSLNIGWALGEITAIDELLLRIRDMKKLLDTKPYNDDGAINLVELSTPPSLEFKNVSFSYPNSSKYVIKDLNLSIKPGEKIAIVGENGAGKTTLVKLITRLYHISEGEILINNKNLNDLSLESWYKNLGALFQDFNTYPDLTAFENIALGRMKDEISYDDIVDAAKKADAYDFIQEFQNNFSQVLSEKYEGGTRPSGGQWQKIAIARFFFRNAPILILDEPTAAIDAVSEANIFDRIYKFIENKTVIIISHRFSTVRNADRIIVFDKGQIVEEGSHQELLAKNGKYAHAFNLQAKGYME